MYGFTQQLDEIRLQKEAADKQVLRWHNLTCACISINVHVHMHV